jgi:hypothetical protein
MVCAAGKISNKKENWGNKVTHAVHASSKQIDASSHVLV